jgi:hypothetical protein
VCKVQQDDALTFTVLEKTAFIISFQNFKAWLKHLKVNVLKLYKANLQFLSDL